MHPARKLAHLEQQHWGTSAAHTAVTAQSAPQCLCRPTQAAVAAAPCMGRCGRMAVPRRQQQQPCPAQLCINCSTGMRRKHISTAGNSSSSPSGQPSNWVPEPVACLRRQEQLEQQPRMRLQLWMP